MNAGGQFGGLYLKRCAERNRGERCRKGRANEFGWNLLRLCVLEVADRPYRRFT